MFVVSNVISVLEIWRGREKERARHSFFVSSVISVLARPCSDQADSRSERARARAQAREAESERHRQPTLCYKHNTPTRDTFCTIWKLALRHEAESERHLLVYEAFRY